MIEFTTLELVLGGALVALIMLSFMLRKELRVKDMVLDMWMHYPADMLKARDKFIEERETRQGS